MIVAQLGATVAADRAALERGSGPARLHDDFHDGSQATLWDVIDHYSKGDGLKDPWLDEDIQPLALTESEIDDLVVFLASLTSPQYRELGIRELARQRALSRVSGPQRDTSRAFGPKPPRPASAPN